MEFAMVNGVMNWDYACSGSCLVPGCRNTGSRMCTHHRTQIISVLLQYCICDDVAKSRVAGLVLEFLD